MIMNINVDNYTVTLDWDLIFEAMKWGLSAELQRRCPTHDSGLRQSIKTMVEDDMLLTYMLDYGIYVEYGTMPHWTSVENLKKWAKDKLGDEKLAYALQRHIALSGTKPHPFIRETIQQEIPKILATALRTAGAVSVLEN